MLFIIAASGYVVGAARGADWVVLGLSTGVLIASGLCAMLALTRTDELRLKYEKQELESKILRIHDALLTPDRLNVELLWLAEQVKRSLDDEERFRAEYEAPKGANQNNRLRLFDKGVQSHRLGTKAAMERFDIALAIARGHGNVRLDGATWEEYLKAGHETHEADGIEVLVES